jgi:hypothetical protein
MDCELGSVTVARISSEDGSYGISAAVELLKEVVAEHSESSRELEAVRATACEESGTIGGTRISYGIADILFPMTPPKPRGARLIRGPLRFN